MREAGHILNAQNVCPHFFELLGLIDVILKRVFRTVGIGDIAGVTNGGFTNGLAVFASGFHGHLHVGKVVEGVEDAEDVHAGVSSVLHETSDNIIGVIRIPNGVRAAEEHLETDIGNALTE